MLNSEQEDERSVATEVDSSTRVGYKTDPSYRRDDKYKSAVRVWNH
jgi:hypothetical protein